MFYSTSLTDKRKKNIVKINISTRILLVRYRDRSRNVVLDSIELYANV